MKCHCRDYQQATGSACAALIVVPKEAFQSFTSGLGQSESFSATVTRSARWLTPDVR
ncbi:GFA family protein [Microvirga sp. BSC39]|uniref:GFA family protein n=1 Tax=Microvirga sp. BSC39 TaxID=1549810 RepID=UPI00244DD1C6|nr:GFA family protein [Microvirga sp. BSC39]